MRRDKLIILISVILIGLPVGFVVYQFSKLISIEEESYLSMNYERNEFRQYIDTSICDKITYQKSYRNKSCDEIHFVQLESDVNLMIWSFKNESNNVEEISARELFQINKAENKIYTNISSEINPCIICSSQVPNILPDQLFINVNGNIDSANTIAKNNLLGIDLQVNQFSLSEENGNHVAMVSFLENNKASVIMRVKQKNVQLFVLHGHNAKKISLKRLMEIIS